MKLQISKKLRIIALISVVALLSIIISSALVACDDNDNNNPDSNYSAYYETVLKNMMGYGLTTFGWCNITISYEKAEKFGEGFLGYAYLYSETNENYVICEIFDYENDTFANINIEQIKNDESILDNQLEWNIFVDGNRVIAETEHGIYDDIKSFSGSIPTSVMSEKQEQFIIDALNATPDLKYLDGGLVVISIYDNYKFSENDESITGLQFEYDFWTLTDNCQETFICTFFTDMEVDIDNNRIMEGSYDKIENNIRYIYLKLMLETNE